MKILGYVVLEWRLSGEPAICGSAVLSKEEAKTEVERFRTLVKRSGRRETYSVAEIWA